MRDTILFILVALMAFFSFAALEQMPQTPIATEPQLLVSNTAPTPYSFGGPTDQPYQTVFKTVGDAEEDR